jgi:Ca2+-binding EF-hand superfamily protein
MSSRKCFVTLALTLTFACCSLGGPAFAQQRARMLFAEMDRDGDGVITRGEWTESAEAFRTHDWNGDGVLSGNEVRPVERYGRSAPREAVGTSGFNDWTAARFTQFDRNGDNRLTRSEWQFDRENFNRADDNGDGIVTREEFLRVGPEEGTAGTPEFSDWTDTRFDRLDRNRDNRITRSEWQFDPDGFNRADDNGNDILSRQEFLRAGQGVGRIGASELSDWSDARFDELDRNRDNRITGGEWQFDRDSFVRADYNGDGIVTRGEFLGLEGIANNETDNETRSRFDRLDRNNDDRITLGEWNGARTAFDQLDTNRNGWLSSVEFARDLNAAQQNTAYQLGYQQGLTEGRAAGREERQRNQAWDLEGQRELESADSGYEPHFGPRTDYQAGYRAGFRVGYPEGWNSAR